MYIYKYICSGVQWSPPGDGDGMGMVMIPPALPPLRCRVDIGHLGGAHGIHRGRLQPW